MIKKQNNLLREHEGVAIICSDRQIGYREMLLRSMMFARHTRAGQGERVIIFSENREGWGYALFGIWQQQAIAVPVDVGSTADDLAYVINDCHPVCVWTNREHLEMVQGVLEKVSFSVDVCLIEDFERTTIDTQEEALVPYTSSQVALIIYTSGTTGSPKGVMLTFGNIMANIDSVSKEVHIFRPELRTMVLLPLHHIFPLLGSLVAPIAVGGGIAISPSMTPQDIMNTLSRGKIGIVIGVPRLWQSLYKGIYGKIQSSPIARMLFVLASKLKSRRFSRFVFSSVRKKMGGHITYCVSGGAALDKEVAVGMRTLGLDVLEGFGMSETAPIITFTRPDDIVPGSVGKPMPSVRVDIQDGEICVKGQNVMLGYYNRPEETAMVMDKAGWLHTGDLGYFDKKGRLYITGRKKEIIVLSNGKNINPSELEGILEHYQDYVKEAAVIQEGDHLRAIIVPQPAYATASDTELESLLKEQVLIPYNATVASYKKIMCLSIYRGDLPRTRLDKLQRFKLHSLLAVSDIPTASAPTPSSTEPSFPEYVLIRNYLASEKKTEVHPLDNLETDLALDSLDKVTLQGFLEMNFGIDLEQSKLLSFKNVLELAEYVAEEKSFVEDVKMDWKTLVNQPVDLIDLPHTWKSGWILTHIFRSFSLLYFRLSFRGLDNIPSQGPFILAPNHQSFLDGMFVISALDRKGVLNTYFYAKSDHVRSPFARMMAHRHNVIVMDTSRIKHSILQLVKVLKTGKSVMIFPEGTRTYNGQVNLFKKTFSILAQEVNVPIVPVCIDGAFSAMPRGSILPRPRKVTVTFLPQICPTEVSTYENLVEQTRTAIEATLGK